jgi:hypothetical protein
MSCGRWLGVLVLAAASGGLVAADDPKPFMDAKTFDKLVLDTLRDVHDRGADLYNLKKDYAGAYRLYQGSLLTVRPMLTHRPDTQKIIDDGLAAAEKEPDPATKAYILHKTIEDVRANIRGMTPKKSEEKKPEDKKKAEEKKPETAPMPKEKGARVSGRVTLNGRPLETGEVTFFSADQPKSKPVTAAIKDGEYRGVELPPGKYKVVISAKQDGKELLPASYSDADKSALVVEVTGAGSNALDFDLKSK